MKPGRVRGPVRNWAVWRHRPEDWHKECEHLLLGLPPLQPWAFPTTLKTASAKSETVISWGLKNQVSPTAWFGWSIRAQDSRPPPSLQQRLDVKSQNPEGSKWNFLISKQFTFASKNATMKPHDSLLRMFHVTSPWSGFHFGSVWLPFFALVTEIQKWI